MAVLRLAICSLSTFAVTSYALSSVPDYFPQLAGLTASTLSSRPLTSGGQEFNHCCLVALNQSLQISNGALSFRSPSYIDAAFASNISAFATAANLSFPCGGVFDGSNYAGAPLVTVPYGWCERTCPGWQISHHDALSQWVAPMVGFILPCLAFVLNIPRSWKIQVPELMWKMSPGRTLQLLSYAVQLPPALALVTLDVVFWLCYCFAFAGPMLVSAVYEAVLDQKLLTRLYRVAREFHKNTAVESLSQDVRAKLLFVVLVGNIKPSGEGPRYQHLDPVGDVDRLTQDLGFGFPHANTVRAKSQLASLLSGQTSFGTAIGAPVVFFIGAFIYNLFDIRSKLGDNDTAHALAFGMWWMVIPVLAIVSNVLLAANNPATFQSCVDSTLVANVHQNSNLSHSMSFKLWKWHPIARSSESRFHPVGLRSRGLNKREWLDRVVTPYEQDPQHWQRNPVLRMAENVRFKRQDDVGILLLSLFLLAVPCLLAGVTSYNTPRVGLACRSLTHLVYFCSQVVQMGLWMANSKLNRGESKLLQYLLWLVMGCVGLIAVFSSVGGTLMQLIGVYRNCLCKIPSQYWLNPYTVDGWVPLSTNSQEAIQKASTLWQNTAIAAIVFLCVACAFGWWHQRRLRRLLRNMIQLINQVDTIRASTSNGHLIGP